MADKESNMTRWIERCRFHVSLPWNLAAVPGILRAPHSWKHVAVIAASICRQCPCTFSVVAMATADPWGFFPVCLFPPVCIVSAITHHPLYRSEWIPKRKWENEVQVGWGNVPAVAKWHPNLLCSDLGMPMEMHPPTPIQNSTVSLHCFKKHRSKTGLM